MRRKERRPEEFGFRKIPLLKLGGILNKGSLGTKEGLKGLLILFFPKGVLKLTGNFWGPSLGRLGNIPYH